MPLIHVTGNPGAGKSSFVVAVIVDKYMTGFDWRYKAACDSIKFEARVKDSELSLPPERHVVFASGIKIRTKFPTMESYDLEGYKLAMPNKIFPTIRVLSYGIYVIDEAQRELDSKGVSKELPFPVTRLYETRRHKHLLIFIISQREKRINADVRCVSDMYVLIEESIHTTKIGKKNVKVKGRFPDTRIISTKFKGRVFDNESDYDAYLSGELTGKKMRYVFHGDIRDFYNPYEFEKEYDGTDETLEDKDYVYYTATTGQKPESYINYNKEVRNGKKSDTKSKST